MTVAQSTVTQRGRLIRIDTPLGEDKLLLAGFSAQETTSRMFRIEADLLAIDADISPEQLLGEPVTVSIEQPNGRRRHFHGLVSVFVERSARQNWRAYIAEIRPWLWLLSRRSNCRVFQNKTVPEIVFEVFDALSADFPGIVHYRPKINDYQTSLTGDYRKLDYCVQYRETDLNFVLRLLEQEGISFFFEHDEHQHTLVLTDAPQHHPEDPHQFDVRYQPIGGTDSRDRDTIFTWQSRNDLRSARYRHRDFHFQLASKTLDATEETAGRPSGNLEIFDYPGGQAEPFNLPDDRLDQVEDEATRLATLRIEEEEARQRFSAGSSDCRDLRSGHKFRLTDHPDANGLYTLVSVQHTAVQSPSYSTDAPVPDAYMNRFRCIAADVRYRPPRATLKPTISGMQTAFVVGPENEEIFTDKYGRVKVQFHWDRYGERDEKSSCWLRVAQAMAGKQWGAHFWPRVGHEVLVSFLEGDPDQPIIVGSLYNNLNLPPYELPQHQTRSGFKTRSSKEGEPEHFNEIRFEDKKDEEQVYIHAERDLDMVAENNETRRIGHDRTTTVGHNERLEVQGTRHEEIGTEMNADDTVETRIIHGVRIENVRGDDGLVVLGDRGRRVQIQQGNSELQIDQGDLVTKVDTGKIDTSAMQSIEFKVGSNSIKIDQTGITLKGVTIKIQGQGTTEVTGAMTTIKGKATAALQGALVNIN